MVKKMLFTHFSIGAVLGAVIACSPTKFNPTTGVNEICDSSVTNCVVEQGFVDLTQNFEVGAGKVDILFVTDSSASMSPVHKKLAEKFAGFIQTLDARKVDYRVAVTTTDLAKSQSQNIVTLANGKSYLSNSDTNRVNVFNASIQRTETLDCEDFIIGMFNTFGTNFQSSSPYATGYYSKCPSPDTRGIYTANLAVSNNAASFIRSDANLSIILISNDEVRQGRFNLANNDSRYLPLEDNDRATTFTSMMTQKYPTKYWDFNSIVVKDSSCQAQQTLRNSQGTVVSNTYGPAISGAIGYEYAALSNSAARDIDNNPRPRGKILDICQADYASHFTSMATQISDAARMINLKCVPHNTPIVKYQGGADVPASLYTVNADKITFKRGTEGQQITVGYKCYTGPK